MLCWPLCQMLCMEERHHHGRGLHHRHGARLPLSMLHQSRRQRSRLLPRRRRRRRSRHLPPVCSVQSHSHNLLHQLPRSWSHDLLLHRHLPLLPLLNLLRLLSPLQPPPGLHLSLRTADPPMMAPSSKYFAVGVPVPPPPVVPKPNPPPPVAPPPAPKPAANPAKRRGPRGGHDNPNVAWHSAKAKAAKAGPEALAAFYRFFQKPPHR